MQQLLVVPSIALIRALFALFVELFKYRCGKQGVELVFVVVLFDVRICAASLFDGMALSLSRLFCIRLS